MYYIFILAHLACSILLKNVSFYLVKRMALHLKLFQLSINFVKFYSFFFFGHTKRTNTGIIKYPKRKFVHWYH